MSVVRLIILGRQGSGKGTQCERLVSTYGPLHISTGDVLRAAVKADTNLGRQAKSIMNTGNLVPDEIMNSIVADRLSSEEVLVRGFLLDGFPRTPAQAMSLEETLDSIGVCLDLVLNLEVSTSEVKRRMLERARADDTEEAIVRRLALYEKETAPLLTWFSERGLLSSIDGTGSEDEVFERLRFSIDDVVSKRY